jgi:hypothetical protein
MENFNKNVETFKITGNWANQSKTLKGKFPQLTDADLKFETGKENELLGRVETRLKLLGRVETRLNKKREEVINIIKKGQPTLL